LVKGEFEMTTILIFVNLILCSLAVGFGSLTLFDLLRKRLNTSSMAWFLRCTLGASLAVLFISLPQLVPAQEVAMVAVYAAGVVILAWRKFHFRGLWRQAFAVALALALYLDVLALSIHIEGFGTNAWLYSQAALLGTAAVLGNFTAKRISESSIGPLVPERQDTPN
jgi:hypothetical protein